MAAALGRGRSRRITNTAAVSTPPPISSDLPPPNLIPLCGTGSPNLFSTPPPASLSSLQSPILVTISSPHFKPSDLSDMIQNNITDDQKITTWINECITTSYSGRLLRENFVFGIKNMFEALSSDQYKIVLVKTLGKLQNEMKRIKPESPSKLSTVGDLCAFAELLSLVAYHVMKPNGVPITELAPHLVDCLLCLLQPSVSHEVLDTVHYICVLYGPTLLEYLEKSGDADAAKTVEDIYDKLRCIAVEDVAKDKSRLLALELIERRAYGYTLPEHCLRYYETEKKK